MIRCPPTTNNDGCRFGHHCRWRATDFIKTRGGDRNKLISTIINNNSLLRQFFIRDLAQYHGRVVAPRTLDCLDPSTPCCQRGGRLGHHCCGVSPDVVVFWLLSHLFQLVVCRKMVRNGRLSIVNAVTFWPTYACTIPVCMYYLQWQHKKALYLPTYYVRSYIYALEPSRQYPDPPSSMGLSQVIRLGKILLPWDPPTLIILLDLHNEDCLRSQVSAAGLEGCRVCGIVSSRSIMHIVLSGSICDIDIIGVV